MKAAEAFQAARDAISVRLVFADPYESGGTTLIAAAAVMGGGGGGTGADGGGAPQGEGGGFGATARPVGAYVIRQGHVTWRPAVDVNRVLMLAALLAVVYVARRPRR